MAVATGTLLLLDLLRVWLPSIITIFGQAASTPAELMGAFALLWFVAGVAAVPLANRLGTRPVALTGAAVLAAARIALIFVHGGQPQLYTASVGLLAGLAWLAATATAGTPSAPGVPLGLAAAAIQHAALSTVDLSWRPWWGALPLALAETALFLWAATGPAPTRKVTGGWLLAGPAMLLAGVYALSPAVAGVFARTPPIAVPQLILGVVALAFVAVTLAGRTPGGPVVRYVAAVLLVGSAALFAWGLGSPVPLWVTLLAGAPPLALALRVAAARPSARPGYAAAGGMVIFAVAAIGYYAAYDIGYPNQWVLPAIALIPAGALLRPVEAGRGAPVRSVRTLFQLRPGDPRPQVTGAGVAAVVACLLVPLVGVSVTPGVAERSGESLRLVAYNIRMGFGLDGTFRPADAAQAIAASRPDVVVLSEVDRAWLLNGGHDDLAVLAQKLRMRYFYGPAADAVWGDAILTDLPVEAVESLRLTADGAPTGAQALGAVVRFGGREIAVVSTHIQPPPGAPPMVQVREISAFADRFAGGRPVFIAGDLNISPGDEAFDAFVDAGYADGFAPFRPVRTFPADRPVKEIDHVLVRGLTCTSVTVGTAVTSDHSLVSATLA